MDKDSVIDKLKDKKGMIYVPKILCFSTYYSLEIAVYNLLDTLLHFSDDKTAILNTIRAAKDFNVEEKKILRSLKRLEGMTLVKGKFIEERHKYVFTIDYEKLLELDEDYEKLKEDNSKIIEKEKLNLIEKNNKMPYMTDEEKEFARELMSKMAQAKTTKG